MQCSFLRFLGFMNLYINSRTAAWRCLAAQHMSATVKGNPAQQCFLCPSPPKDPHRHVDLAAFRSGAAMMTTHGWGVAEGFQVRFWNSAVCHLRCHDCAQDCFMKFHVQFSMLLDCPQCSLSLAPCKQLSE